MTSSSPLLAIVSLDALLAAILTGVAAIITAWAAIIRAKKEGGKQCKEDLRVAQEEAEGLQARLHRIRMAHPEVMEDEPHQRGDDVI